MTTMTTINTDNPLSILNPLLDDPNVMAILVDGYAQVYVEKEGKLQDVPSPFQDAAQLVALIDAVAASMGQTLNESQPIGNLRLPDGSHVHIVIPPIALNGPYLAIRKFPRNRPTIENLLEWGCLNEAMVQFLRACVAGRVNMLVCGNAGSGKTTVMNLIADMVPAEERIILVQSSENLKLTQKRVVRLETRPANLLGRGAVTADDLINSAVEMRPDRIIVTEVLGGEALTLLQAMNTGHTGTLFTMHANGVRDVLSRFEVLVTTANPSIPLLSIREQISSSLQVIVYQEHFSDGTRRVAKISEVVGLQGDVVMTQDLFEFQRTGIEHGEIMGRFQALGHIPRFLNQIREAGVDMPIGLFSPE